jgi:hypothetical protein
LHVCLSVCVCVCVDFARVCVGRMKDE